MGFFKKNEEVLDLTLLQKKGILKVKEIEKEEIDLTKPQASSVMTTETVGSTFDFLDNAQINSNQNYLQTPPPQASSPDLQDLKVKLENLEYKFERFLERLEKFEEKLSSLTR